MEFRGCVHEEGKVMKSGKERGHVRLRMIASPRQEHKKRHTIQASVRFWVHLAVSTRGKGEVSWRWQCRQGVRPVLVPCNCAEAVASEPLLPLLASAKPLSDPKARPG